MPDNVKVILFLIVGLFVIVWLNPPHSACESAMDGYQESLKPVLGVWRKAITSCQNHADPGGCAVFFEAVENFRTRLQQIPSECGPTAAKNDSTRSRLESSLQMLVALAWGSVPPTSYLYRNGWLDFSQVVLYCRLRNQYISFYSADAWNEFASSVLDELPNASKINRNDAWNRSLLSDPCRYQL